MRMARQMRAALLMCAAVAAVAGCTASVEAKPTPDGGGGADKPVTTDEQKPSASQAEKP